MWIRSSSKVFFDPSIKIFWKKIIKKNILQLSFLEKSKSGLEPVPSLFSGSRLFKNFPF